MHDQTDRHTTLLDQRYGNQEKPQNLVWNPVVEIQLAHKSVRTFLPEALPEGALETMVAAAQSASTGSALHQWSVITVTDGALKQRISDTIARTVPTDRIPWIEEAPTLLLWVADLSRSAAITRERGAEPVVHDYLDAFLMATVDTSLAAQNAALAAESMGLGIVFLGVVRNAAQEIAEFVGLPPHTFFTFGMAVGHPDQSRQSVPRPRPPQSVMLHENRYDSEGFKAKLDSYEDAYRAFREGQNMRPRSWQDAVHESATSMAYMSGRADLRDMVTARGLTLR
ncbi:nitroreductase family protein [Caulobacter sp. RHG1]|uniref:nitroreductase family protein n=1 Tax=Caulobacter sp. (strain RHG1) TaxID=2545762 RepID=UPI001557E53F|nr:nitroreductase family protein [Caulobacter sp. RHG1]NQE65366.1 hypothetical protein [Caulobacter sp. RHG1]